MESTTDLQPNASNEDINSFDSPQKQESIPNTAGSQFEIPDNEAEPQVYQLTTEGNIMKNQTSIH